MTGERKTQGALVRRLLIEPPAFPEVMLTKEDVAEEESRISRNQTKPVEAFKRISSGTETLTDVFRKYPVPCIAASLLLGAGSVLWMRGLTRVALNFVASEFEPELAVLKRASKEAVVSFVTRRLDSLVPEELDS